jgi:multisubunit Na+/H+ antiporter MnhB subunit
LKRVVFFALFLIVAAFFVAAAVKFHSFGEPGQTDMDTYFIENSQLEIAANNAVTAIVFDYRGFDTLGEATVLFAAVLGVAAMLRKTKSPVSEAKKIED